jgi:PAS domain S-box-containing protein
MKTEAPTTTTTEVKTAANNTANILLVDDEAGNLEVLKAVLDAPELHLVCVQTPEAALLALMQHEFACIVLDIQLPTMSGLELAQLIKTRKRNKDIPIIFLTAFFQEDIHVLQGYHAGAVDYLTKPLNPDILKSKVRVFVNLFLTTCALTVANNSLEYEIIQRRKAEEALREANNELASRVESKSAELDLTEKRYRQVVHSLPGAVYTIDIEGRVTLYNDAAVNLWGRRPEIGRDLWCGSFKTFNPDGSPLPLEEGPMAVTLKTGHSVRGREIIIERPDGTRRNVLPYPEPIRDIHDNIIGGVNMLVDITELKQSEELARRLAAIVESSDDAIISKNMQGIVMSWNRGAEQLFGYSAAEMLGQSIALLIPADRIDEEPYILARIARGEGINHYETIRRHKDGTLRQISLTVSPIKNADGNVIGASKIARDISERNRIEQELKTALQKVVEASRAKDDFLATLSHELRTPLNPVLLIASEAVNDRELPPGVLMNFDTIRKSVELEARLIDDLLDLTSITRGKINLEKQFLDVRHVLDDVVTNLQEDIHQKQIVLDLKLKALRHRVYADAARLQQIFLNLIKNAIKFTPAGGQITVSSEVRDERLFIAITDTGIGMTPEEIARLFTAFSQGNHANKNNAHRFGGLGLGLAISKKLAEFHSGQIHAKSEGINLGSTFTVEIPLAQPAENDAKKSANRPPSSLTEWPAKTSEIRILLVEDHVPTCTALTQLLLRRKFKVSTATSIAEARHLVNQESFNLLISDIGLPDGTGYELMEELRKRFKLKGIALTGYGMEQDVARSKQAGFMAHLTKPVRIDSLDNALKTILAGESPETTSSKSN